MRTGVIRSSSRYDYQTLEVCSHRQWKPFKLDCSACSGYRVRGLIGHWRMDEQTGNEVADDSGHEHHGSTVGPAPILSKFSRGRSFNAAGVITVASSTELNFGTSSFTVAGWVKILDVTYPLTTFAVRKGFGCYFKPGSQGAVAGWDTGHGYTADGLRVCIRDHNSIYVYKLLAFDNGYRPDQLLGQWVHYAVVFDRQKEKIVAYVNSKQMAASVDISAVKGSVDNARPLEFGALHGWSTKGILDEYRLYDTAITGSEVKAIYGNHLV